MVEKSRHYRLTKYSVGVVRHVHDLFCIAFDGHWNATFTVTLPEGPTSWNRSGSDKFFGAYPKSSSSRIYITKEPDYMLAFDVDSTETRVTVQGPTEEFANSILDVFEESKATSALPARPPIIFIGHGRHLDWKDLRDHLRDQQKIDVVSYESDPHAGHIIPGAILSMAVKSTFAVLVFTAEDEQIDGKFNARQNVVHELGFLTARLGTEKALVLLEIGTETPTNISGVHVLPFPPDQISSTFGDVVAAVRREFPTLWPADYISIEGVCSHIER